MNATSVRQIIRWLRRIDNRMADLTPQRFFSFCYMKMNKKEISLVRLTQEVKDFNERDVIPYYVVIFVKKYTLRSFICR